MGEQPALLTADNPVFSGFVFWSMVLALKMLLLYFLTVRQRFKKKIFISPEDTFFAPSGDGQVRYDDPDIERIRRAHQNDVENIPLFFAVGFLYVLSGPSEAVALNLFRVYAAARIVHTLVYAVVVTRQPVRAVAFFVGLSVTLAMVVLTLVTFHHL
ncbi:microsomal glutathione S-transferase 1-like [Bacillus rossius redtenbacheri]|uniref:microsomal glutathione S-transferase 1-like n=1 Tax=Bacillus rossius redtenbacheri TaxID=93214 RepID=UPI002FDD43BC